jgi:hypothetical protein
MFTGTHRWTLDESSTLRDILLSFIHNIDNIYGYQAVTSLQTGRQKTRAYLSFLSCMLPAATNSSNYSSNDT